MLEVSRSGNTDVDKMTNVDLQSKYPQWMHAQNQEGVLSDTKTSYVQRSVLEDGLPFLEFHGSIIYSYEASDCSLLSEDIRHTLSDGAAVGFDIEWPPSYTKGKMAKIAVIQICVTEEKCYLFHISAMSGFPKGLKRLLEDETIKKVGVGIEGDHWKLMSDFEVKLNHFVELADVANEKLKCKEIWSLNGLVKHLFGKQLLKDKSIRCSNWEKFPLDEEQKSYAATDAYAGFIIYQKLKNMDSADRKLFGERRGEVLSDDVKERLTSLAEEMVYLASKISDSSGQLRNLQRAADILADISENVKALQSTLFAGSSSPSAPERSCGETSTKLEAKSMNVEAQKAEMPEFAKKLETDFNICSDATLAGFWEGEVDEGEAEGGNAVVEDAASAAGSKDTADRDDFMSLDFSEQELQILECQAAEEVLNRAVPEEECPTDNEQNTSCIIESDEELEMEMLKSLEDVDNSKEVLTEREATKARKTPDAELNVEPNGDEDEVIEEEEEECWDPLLSVPNETHTTCLKMYFGHSSFKPWNRALMVCRRWWHLRRGSRLSTEQRAAVVSASGGRSLTLAMEQVIKVLFHLCKEYCGKNAPSKKKISSVFSLLEREGELVSPQHALDSKRWDSITSALGQYAMSSQKAAELKTWGLMLGALKAAKEEWKCAEQVQVLLESAPDPRGDSGGSTERGVSSHCRCRDVDKMALSNSTAPREKGEQQQDGGRQPPLAQSSSYEVTQPQEGEERKMPPPDPHQPSYPSLCNLMPEVGGTDKPQPCTAPSAPKVPKGMSQGYGQDSDWSKALLRDGPMLDWSANREALDDQGFPVASAVPTVVGEEGPQWVPPDPECVVQFVDAIKKKGLRSPRTLNALEILLTLGPVIPYDIEYLMHIALEPLQFIVWKEEWASQLKKIIAVAGNNPQHPVHGTTLQRLMGTAPDMLLTPQRQITQLRPMEGIATANAAVVAFMRFAIREEPSAPWADIVQGPTESFQEFADRLIKAVEDSDLPRAAHNPVILDWLKQRSTEDVKALLRMAQESLDTPSEVIQYVLDKQKTAPLSYEEIASAVSLAMGAVVNRMGAVVVQTTAGGAQRPIGMGPCFRCGQYGHIKAQCRVARNQAGPVCQICGRPGHTAIHCRALRGPFKGNRKGKGLLVRGPSPPLRNGHWQTTRQLMPPPFSTPDLTVCTHSIVSFGLDGK